MRAAFLLLSLAALSFGQSEKFNHVQWKLTLPPAAAPGATVLGRLDAAIDPDWHMYSFTTPPGPIATSLESKDSPAIESVTVFEPPPVRRFDPNFNLDTETYEGAQTFYARIALKKDAAAGPATITLIPRYQTCSGTSCIPPRTRTVTATLNIAPGTASAAANLPAGYIEVKDDDQTPAAPPAVAGVASAAASAAVAPVPAAAESGLGSFLLLAFGFGLAAVFTPCVFPMIPITMSYFVGQSNQPAPGKPKASGLGQAITFCLGIMVLFSGLGLLVTAFVGPAGVVQLGSNVWVNGFISIVFFTFGMSLLGAFEITIPSGVLTKLNNASGQGGILGTLLMGLTFALASFACVGPFMGTLLAASVGAEKLRPVLGMVVFSAGLALPFFLLALFPGVLAKLPRSGEWLSRVKVVMGFFVLAAMMKYLHNVDEVLNWGLLSRDRFLAGWIVLFAIAGFYLLGFVRLPGISRDHELGVPRLLIGLAIVAFGLSLVPGMYCQRLGEIETYLPPPDACPVGAAATESSQLLWLENDLDAAFARAKAEDKRVLVDFTGDSCTNCKWMKANLFTRPEISAAMKNLVLVELYTDRTDEAAKKFQKLEEDQFHTVAIPFYVLYDSSHNVLSTFADRTTDSAKYLAFLNPPAAAKSTAATAAEPALDGAPFHTLDGAALATSSWRGKVVVLNYWATWCVPCREEIPEFNRLHEEMASKGVEVVGIAMDDGGVDAVKPFLAKTPMRYTVGIGTGSFDALPVTIVFDRAGKPVQRFNGLAKPAEIRAAVAKAQNAG